MKKMIVVMLVVACAATGLFASPIGATTEAVVQTETPDMCTITIKGTYDGKDVNLTVTVQADNCARAAGDLLRQIVNKK